MHPSPRGIFLNRNRYLLLVIGVGLLLALIPFFTGSYWLKFFSFLIVNIIIGCSWNLIGGFCNYFSFGHGVFFGIGAYAMAIGWIRYQVNFYLAIVIGGICGALIALFISPILRLKGLNFALGTLALLEAVHVIFHKWSFTRGLKIYDDGWKFQPSLGDTAFYYLILLTFVLMLISFILFLSSRFGFATAAFKEDELMAKGIGIHTTVSKVMAFVLSAFWVGIIGAVYAPMISYISTTSIFGLTWSVKPIIVSIFGGLGTLLGPILGGVILNFIDHLLWERFLEFHTLIYGVLLIAIVVFLPNGLMHYKPQVFSFFGSLKKRIAGDSSPDEKRNSDSTKTEPRGIQ